MRIRLWAVAALATGLAGCDYTVQLAKTPELPIDRALVGVWSRTNDNEPAQRLLVLPLGPNEYLVSFPAGDKNAMFANACLCKAGEWTLAQLAWFGTARGVTPDDTRVYQYAAYTVKGDTLQIGLLNADVVPRAVTTAEALIKALASNRENPELFRDTMTFKKEPPPTDPNARLKRPPVPAAWQ